MPTTPSKAVSAHVEITLEDGTRHTVNLTHSDEHPLHFELAVDVESREKPTDGPWVEREPTGRKFASIRITGLATNVDRHPPT